MQTEINNETWVVQTLRLVQALLGAVSPNFRMVGLAHDGLVWRLIFLLAVESQEDREEIKDIAFEFEALQDSSIAYEIDVGITNDPIAWTSGAVRVIYRRREE